MNFLKQIKNDINTVVKHRGHQHKVTVNTRALYELIHHFEKLDAEARARHNEEDPAMDAAQRLHEALLAAYHAYNKNVDELFIIIAEALLPEVRGNFKERLHKQFLRGKE